MDGDRCAGRPVHGAAAREGALVHRGVGGGAGTRHGRHHDDGDDHQRLQLPRAARDRFWRSRTRRHTRFLGSFSRRLLSRLSGLCAATPARFATLAAFAGRRVTVSEPGHAPETWVARTCRPPRSAFSTHRRCSDAGWSQTTIGAARRPSWSSGIRLWTSRYGGGSVDPRPIGGDTARRRPSSA